MKKFKEYMQERFVNAVDTKQMMQDLKVKYADQVWNILQKSYADIGGIKGSGFSSKEDMIANIPFWKMVINNGTVHGVVLYKDKDGRKSVAMASDGSDYAKKHLSSIVANDIKRSYGEKSKAALGTLLKNVPWSVLEAFTKTPQEAEKILGDPVTPITKLDKKDWPKDALLTLEKAPHLLKYAYVREIGGGPVFKVMFGTPGKVLF